MEYIYIIIGFFLVLYVIEKINIHKQVSVRKKDSEQPKEELVNILNKLDIVPFLKRYFKRITTDFMDKEGKEFFKDYILKFIFDNELQQSQGTKKRYPYEKIKKLLESIYPQDPMSDILILDNSGMNPSFYRRHENQRHYNRRRVSNNYFSFVKSVLLEKQDLIFNELGFTVQCYLTIMEKLLNEEIRLHSRSESDVESYFINVSEIYFDECKKSEVKKIVEFLCSSDSAFKLYQIDELLLASDYIMLYDNMFSIIVDRLKDRKSGFGNVLGRMFENELKSLFASKYTTYSNCTIDSQEIDLVCLFGDIVFMIEAKARYYPVKSMENEQNRNNARKKVENAIKQLNSRMDSLYQGSQILDTNGNFVADKNTTTMVMPILITLEDLFELNNITGDTASKRGLEFLAFSISLDEMNGIFENMVSPFHLVNYIYKRNMEMIFNKHHFHLDKFSDYIIKNKQCKHIDRYGVHLQYKIRDHYSVNRVLESWGKVKRNEFADSMDIGFINLLNEISNSKHQKYNSYVSLLLDYLYSYPSIENIIDKELVLNKIDIKGNNQKEVWMISFSEKNKCDYLILLDQVNNQFKRIIKK